jgi:SAM-dependent methyltransferase
MLQPAESAKSLETFVAARFASMPRTPEEPDHDSSTTHRSVNINVVRRKTRSFLKYRSYLVGAQRVLDLGCKHAIDGQLVRRMNPDAEIHAADFWDFENLPEFKSDRITYRRLSHSWDTGYPDAYFDAVIMSGSFEHVPNEAETLKEVYRVLKPDGVLVMSFLPNWLSWAELAFRLLKGRDEPGTAFHLRLYSLRQLRRMHLASGFRPVASGRFQFLPSLSEGYRYVRFAWLRRLLEGAFRMDPVLESIWPIGLFCSNLWIVSHKQPYI